MSPQIQKISESRDSANAMLQVQTSEIALAHRRNAELEEKIHLDETERDRLLKNLDETKNQNEELARKSEQRDRDNAQLAQQNVQLAEENEQRARKNDQLTRDNEQLAQQIDTLKEDREAAMKEMKRKIEIAEKEAERILNEVDKSTIVIIHSLIFLLTRGQGGCKKTKKLSEKFFLY